MFLLQLTRLGIHPSRFYRIGAVAPSVGDVYIPIYLTTQQNNMEYTGSSYEGDHQNGR